MAPKSQGRGHPPPLARIRYHALRHSFISILVAQGKTWDQIAAFVGHLDQRTTQRDIHFMPKDKRETANSIPFEC